MNSLKNRRTKRIIICITSIITILVVSFVACAIYVNDYYHADTKAIAAFDSAAIIKKEVIDDRTIVYTPQNTKAGFIFYPGGKVEYTAYEPLMKACAEQDILCVLIKMPFNLAVLDINAAEGIQEKYPEIDNWYIGGHSLGGSMAASYLENNTDDFSGLVLLGSYSTADLSKSGINVLSVYGSEDKVLSYEKYTKNKSNLPDDYTEFVIEGGCHAYFGMYGAQDGDGVPTITNEDQICITAEKIAELVN